MRISQEYRRRDFLGLLGVAGAGLAGAGVLSACGGAGAAGTGSRDLTAAASHFDVIVHHAPIHAGLARGFFDEVIPEFTSFAGGSDTVRAVTTGSNEWCLASGTGPVLASIAGEDMVLTSAWFNETDVSFLARPDSPIATPADLRGRTVAQSKPGSNTEYLIKKAMDEAGIGSNEVRIVSLGGAAQQATALANGVVDVITTTEPSTSLFERDGSAKVIFSGRDITSPWMELTGSPMRPFLEANQDVLVALHASLQRCIDFVDSSPDEVAMLWAGAVEQDEDIARAAVRRYAGTNTWSLKFDQGALQNLSEGAQFLKIVTTPIDWTSIVDQSALPEPARIAL